MFSLILKFKMLFNNPFGLLAKILIKGAIKYFKLPLTLYSAFSILMSTSTTLISSFGVVPVLRVLFRLPAFILAAPVTRRSIQNVTTLMSRSLSVGLFPLNMYIIERILNDLTPEIWKDCLKYIDQFIKIYKFLFIPFLFLGAFKPLLRAVYKTFIALTFGSVGVIHSDTLSSIGSLKNLSVHFLDFIGSISPFNFNGVSDSFNEITDQTNSSKGDPINSATADTLAVIGGILAGLTVVICVLLSAEYFYPDQVHSIPYVNSFTETIHNCISFVYNYFSGGPGNAPDLDAISTTSSSSDRTITLNDIRPTSSSSSSANLPASMNNLPSTMLSAQASSRISATAAFNALNNFN